MSLIRPAGPLDSSIEETTIADGNGGSPSFGDRNLSPAGSQFGPAPTPASRLAGDPLDAALNYQSPIFKGNREALRESYVPARLPHRERQIAQVAEVLAPNLRGDLSSNLLIYGKIGTGKTAVVHQVRLEMERRATGRANISFVAINCHTTDSQYSLLQTIGNVFATKDSERIPTGWALDRVQAAMKDLIDRRGGSVILILDEIDRLVANSGDSVLYTLSQFNEGVKHARLVIVGISNDLRFTNNLDARIRSRLNEEKILFPPYDAVQLQDILKDRASAVFQEGVLDAGVIERCAAYAALENGDARRALALLRLSAEMAERDRARRVTSDHVVKAKSRLETDIILDCCRTLPSHCKVLLYALLLVYERRRAPVATGEVYEIYSRLSQRLHLQPLHNRSISNHLSDLESLGLVRGTIVSRGRAGRTREFVVDVPMSETFPALEADPLLTPLGRPRGSSQKTLFTNFDNPDRTGPSF